LRRVVLVHGGVKFCRGAANAARAYVERDRSRADDYYLGEGTGVAVRLSWPRRPRAPNEQPPRGWRRWPWHSFAHRLGCAATTVGRPGKWLRLTAASRTRTDCGLSFRFTGLTP